MPAEPGKAWAEQLWIFGAAPHPFSRDGTGPLVPLPTDHPAASQPSPQDSAPWPWAPLQPAPAHTLPSSSSLPAKLGLQIPRPAAGCGEDPVEQEHGGLGGPEGGGLQGSHSPWARGLPEESSSVATEDGSGPHMGRAARVPPEALSLYIQGLFFSGKQATFITSDSRALMQSLLEP